ncbi:hypothetical protein JCM10212_001318 [Sporobolomyces blumeae]
MDQSAFRQLLSSSSATSSTRPKSHHPTAFGQPRPKPPTASSSSSSTTLTDLKPRPNNPKRKANKSSSSSTTKDGYRDRAAERRAGKDGDFADAEKLLEDFKARSEHTDKSTLEHQLAYLGGDAHHSILVKGLDRALLERNKAKLAGDVDQSLDDVEDQLDRCLVDRDGAEAHAVAGTRQGKGKGKEKEVVETKKGKSRDDLLAELRARKGKGGPIEGDQAPLSASSGAAGGGLGKGWKRLGAGTPGSGFAPVDDARGEEQKKRRKKKKKVVDSGAPPAPSTGGPADMMTKEGSPPLDSSANSLPVTGSASTGVDPPPIEAVNDFGDGDDDIFGDAGSYKGFDSDSDRDEDEKDKSKPDDPRPSEPASSSTSLTAVKYSTGDSTIAASRGPAGRNWFEEDEADQDAEPISTAPVGVHDLASRQASHVAARSGPRTAAGAKDDDDDAMDRDDDDDDDGRGGEAGVPTKLVPLSGSKGPSVRELLEMDKAAADEEKRRERKLKRQQGLPVSDNEDANDGDRRRKRARSKKHAADDATTAADKERKKAQDDRSNREYLEMQAFLDKRDKAKRGTE